MIHLGKSLLIDGKVKLLKDILEQVDKISSKDILEISNEIFDETKLSYLTYLPE